ncbi:14048_t:CDS:2 [Gigaspora margarita]|uniref:14048_t:CDS:1 n=1 Tax=Gigaspora margarita TaxID=4874 RepID=A0ABN7VFF2_GIGMA|nr:14048_t:CDS:2 [Gigaspora margarita]
MDEEKQLELEEHNEETFPDDDINYISDINANNSFGQVSESSASNVSRVSNSRKRKSMVWVHFDRETVENFGRLVCLKCEQLSAPCDNMNNESRPSTT